MVVKFSGLNDLLAKSWLSKNWTLSPLSSAECWLFPQADGEVANHFQVSCPDAAVPWESASFEGFLLEVRNFFSEALSLLPSRPLFTHWPQLGPCPFPHKTSGVGSTLPSHTEEQWIGAHTTTVCHYSQWRVCVCGFSPLGLVFQILFPLPIATSFVQYPGMGRL